MVIQKIREYSGEGKFSFNVGEIVNIDSKFNLYFFANGKIEVSCYLNMFSKEAVKIVNENSMKLIEVALEGSVESPKGKISIEKLYIDSINIRFNEGALNSIVKLVAFSEANLKFYEETPSKVNIRFGMVNFVFGGCEMTRLGEHGFKYDKFSVKIDETDITFKQMDDYKRITEQLKIDKSILVTSEAMLECDYSQMRLKEDIIDNSFRLMSFATGTYLSWIYEDIFENEKLVETKLLPHKTMNYNHRDLVIDSDHLGNCDLKLYLETAYNNYLKFKDSLGFYAVIDYYVSSKSIKDLLEIKYLVAVTLLDCLTSYLSDYFKEKNKQEDLSTFKNRVVSILKEFNIQYKEQELDFIKTRDKIIHTGRFPANKSPLEEYHKLINFIDRILLKILGYNGSYLNIANRYKKESLS